MFMAYAVLSLLIGGYLAFSAWADFVRYQQVLVAMARAGVPESWLPLLGTLSLFFVGAIVIHPHACYYAFVFPGSFLVLAVATLGLALANLDVWRSNCDLLLRGCGT